ncbi:MAG: Phosphoserine phosphatase RsbU [Chlamydiae bacterium]|nr:Phosphoserine phosphatase RsbU [Chlamydiota bacterium]
MTSTSPYQMTKQHHVKVLLVDDQAIISESVKVMLADEKDIEFAYCSDPTKAIDVANDFEPTVILQDLLMPEIDGMTLVRYFRANPKTKEVPLIVLSAKEEPTVKAEAFANGVNDYLVKLPSKEEMIARIRYHSKGYISMLERNEAFEKLAQSQSALQQELDEAADYVRSLFPEPITGDITTYWKFIPSAQLGGDAFGYHWIDDQNFAIYLIDVCGHGVKAALLSISVINVLRSQSLSQSNYLEPSSVLNGLNHAFPMESNNNMFFSMWYGVYNKETKALTYSSGGHPPAFLIDQENHLNELHTGGVLIGGFSDATFNQETTFIKNPSRLLVFSDGVFELERSDNTHSTFTDFKNQLKAMLPGDRQLVEKIESWSREINGAGSFADDFSLLQVDFYPNE